MEVKVGGLLERLLNVLIIPIEFSVLDILHGSMLTLVPNSLRAFGPFNARGVIQHDNINFSLDGLVALVFNIATIVDAMKPRATIGMRVIASAKVAAALGDGRRMIANNKNETLGPIHPLLEGLLYAARQTRIVGLLEIMGVGERKCPIVAIVPFM